MASWAPHQERKSLVTPVFAGARDLAEGEAGPLADRQRGLGPQPQPCGPAVRLLQRYGDAGCVTGGVSASLGKR